MYHYTYIACFVPTNIITEGPARLIWRWVLWAIVYLVALAWPSRKLTLKSSCLCYILVVRLQKALTFRWPCIVINSYNKSHLNALISQIYFWNKTLHVSDSSSVHYQEFFTVHPAMVCTVKNFWWWTEELSETCRVLFQ